MAAGGDLLGEVSLYMQQGTEKGVKESRAK